MCDWIDGELVVAFPRNDLIARSLLETIRHGQLPWCQWLDSVDERVASLDVPVDRALGLEFHLLKVPDHQEQWAITQLHTDYRKRLLDDIHWNGLTPSVLSALTTPDRHFIVATNGVMKLAFKWPWQRNGTQVKAEDFEFDVSTHDGYMSALNVPLTDTPELAEDIKILVVDSGIASDRDKKNLTVASERNFVDHTNKFKAVDDVGHGTAVALIINDIIPEAQVSVYKVADSSGRASEWDTLAALGASSGFHVINLSLEFGLEDQKCGKCGRESGKSRSMVFESMLKEIQKRQVSPVLVAAAGNVDPGATPSGELAYPARFGQVVAISSVSSQKKISDFSEYGAVDPEGDEHKTRFVSFGGDSGGTIEGVGKFGQHGDLLYGTSFAVAYASGVIAQLIAKHGVEILEDGTLQSVLEGAADKSVIVDYDKAVHGHGLLRLKADNDSEIS